MYSVCSVLFITFRTEFFPFHMNFISLQFRSSLGFPQREGHRAKRGTRRLALQPCQVPRRESPTSLYCCVSDKRTLGGAVGPVPAAQLVTPDQAQQLPWQLLHCAPRRPRVTAADAPTSRRPPPPLPGSP